MYMRFKFKSEQLFQNLNIIPLFLILLLSFSTLPLKVYSQENTISSIIVDGNKRITTDTIINISEIKKGISKQPGANKIS